MAKSCLPSLHRLANNMHQYSIALLLFAVFFMLIWTPLWSEDAFAATSVHMCVPKGATLQDIINFREGSQPCAGTLYPVLMGIKNNEIAMPDALRTQIGQLTGSMDNHVKVTDTLLDTSNKNYATVRDLLPHGSSMRNIADKNVDSFGILQAGILCFVFVVVSIAVMVGVVNTERPGDMPSGWNALSIVLLWVAVGIDWGYIVHPVYESSPTGSGTLLQAPYGNPVTADGFVTLFTFVLLVLAASFHTMDTVGRPLLKLIYNAK